MLKATVIGNIGGDAESKQTKNGDSYLAFSVAHDKGRNQPTIWVRVVWFGGVNNPVAAYLKKGAKLAVTGNLVPSVYMDRANQPALGLDLYADSVDVVLYPKREEAAPAAAPTDPNHAPIGSRRAAPAPAAPAPAGGYNGGDWGPGNPDYDNAPDFLKDDGDMPE